MKIVNIALIIIGVVMLIIAPFYMPRGYFFVFAVGILVLIALNVINIVVIDRKKKENDRTLKQ